MTLSPKHLYVLIGIVALSIVIGLVGSAYISSRDDATRQQQVKSDVKEQMDAMRAELKDALDAIKHDREQVRTPQQVVERLPQYVELPKPIYLQPAVTQTSGMPNVLPDAPSAGALIIPKESVQAFWEHEATCKEDSLKLAECNKELPLITKRAEFAEKAMKGGGFFTQVKRNAKWFVIGGTIGAGAVLATRR